MAVVILDALSVKTAVDASVDRLTPGPNMYRLSWDRDRAMLSDIRKAAECALSLPGASRMIGLELNEVELIALDLR